MPARALRRSGWHPADRRGRAPGTARSPGAAAGVHVCAQRGGVGEATPTARRSSLARDRYRPPASARRADSSLAAATVSGLTPTASAASSAAALEESMALHSREATRDRRGGSPAAAPGISARAARRRSSAHALRRYCHQRRRAGRADNPPQLHDRLRHRTPNSVHKRSQAHSSIPHQWAVNGGGTGQLPQIRRAHANLRAESRHLATQLAVQRAPVLRRAKGRQGRQREAAAGPAVRA